MFWRESEIFLENETLYPSDTVIKCMLCTAVNIVLWDCTQILKADTVLNYILEKGQQIQQEYARTKLTVCCKRFC